MHDFLIAFLGGLMLGCIGRWLPVCAWSYRRHQWLNRTGAES